MIPVRFASAALLIFIGFSQAAIAQTWHTDLNEARQEAERLNRPLLCHFGADWCAPCVKMERTVLNQPPVLNQFKDNLVGVKIDIVKNPELATRFGVDRFPMDVIIEPNGKRLMNSSGYQSVDDYVKLMSQAQERYSTILASRQDRTPATEVSNHPEQSANSALAQNSESVLMLNGYCPVNLGDSRKWIKGDSEFAVEYKGQKFNCASLEAKMAFMKKSEKYAPQFLGCDPVMIFTADRAVPGSVEWGAYYNGKLYLFANNENRQSFKESPQKYVRTQVVLKLDEIESVIR